MHDCASLAAALIAPDRRFATASITDTLARYGADALRFASANGVRIAPLRRAERYSAASSALARIGIDVDLWPAPPAGLFVVEERTVYLRSRSPMTVAHEFGHALDCALGGGVYHSGVDPELRRLFTAATQFVTPYSATGIDEYLAEALRAFIEVNDPTSHWPRATRLRLRKIDAQLYDYVDRLFRCSFVIAA